MSKTLGKTIKELRRSKNITQTQLGDLLGVAKTTISSYETDYSTPDVETIKKLANYFNVTTDYLLGHTTDPKLNRKDEKDIATRLKLITEDLSSDAEIMFDGDIIDEETKELFMASLETVLKISKIKAKEKFTPNKI